jgi:cytochrome c-type biogenesis protein CcmH
MREILERHALPGVRFLRAAVLAATLVGCSAPAFAVQPDEVLKDPALESRARALSSELRCLVCQNQSIDDSDAPLARDLRILVRERLQAGDSDEAVKGFLVSRYGEFVLLKPAFGWHTALLWAGPFAVLALGAAIVIGTSRRRRSAAANAALSPEEAAALERLIDGKG